MNPVAFFIDINLDNENGLDTIPHIRAKWPYTPIIVITSSSDPKVVAEALATGANDFLSKPLNPIELKARLLTRIKEMNDRIESHYIEFSDIKIDPIQRVIKKSSPDQAEQIQTDVTKHCVTLLSNLIYAPDHKLERTNLKRLIWGQTTVSDNSVDKLISGLRKSLKSINSKVEVKCRKKDGVFIYQSSSSEKKS